MRFAFALLWTLLFFPLLLNAASPSNDRCINATPITTGLYQGTSCRATPDGTSSCDGAWSAPDVWYRYTAEADGTVAIDTFGSNYDTIVSVHSGCPGTEENAIVCNDDCGQAGSCLSFAVAAGRTYFIRVGGYHDQAGAFNLQLTRQASISGRVTDSANGQGLADVALYLYKPDGTYIRTTTSDTTGAYSFAGMTPGTYIARTTNSAGYVDELYNNVVCEGVGCSPAWATVIQVTEGKAARGIDFALDYGGSITGVVTDAAGAPMGNAEVHVHDSANTHITLDFTDADGRYRTYDGLPSGNYLVMVVTDPEHIDQIYPNIPCPNLTCDPFAGTLIPVTLGVPTTGINFALQAAGKIHGLITDSATGQPVNGVQVNVYGMDGTRITSGNSDSTGAYGQIDGLSSGQYLLRTLNGVGYVDQLYAGISCTGGACSLAGGTPVQVQTGQVTGGIDFHMDPGGRITGAVTDSSSGAPLPGVLVDLHDAANQHIHWEYTDANGVFSSYYGLDTGQYFLRTFNYDSYMDELFDNLPCPSGYCNIMQGTPVAVQKGNVTGNVHFQLDRGGVIAGSVTQSANQLPIGNVIIDVFDATGALWAQGQSDSCGNYTTYEGLNGGNYMARTSNSSGFIDEFYDNVLCLWGGCGIQNATPIPVASGQRTEGIDFALSQLLLSDNFQDGNLAWKPKAGTWLEQNGVLTGTPPPTGSARLLAPDPWIPSGAHSCSQCTIQFETETSGGPGSKIYLQGWYRDASNRVELSFNQERGLVVLKQVSGGITVARTRRAFAIQPGTRYHVRVVFENSEFQVYVENNLLLTAKSTAHPEGGIRLEVKGGTATFDNFLVY